MAFSDPLHSLAMSCASSSKSNYSSVSFISPTQQDLSAPGGIIRAPLTVADIDCLVKSNQALVSDFTLLRREFSQDHNPDHSNTLVFKRAGYSDCTSFFDFEARVHRLSKDIQSREQEQADEQNYVRIEDSNNAIETDWNNQIQDERKIFNELKRTHDEMVSDCRFLRRLFEGAGKNAVGIYEYAVQAQYELIGDQTISHVIKTCNALKSTPKKLLQAVTPGTNGVKRPRLESTADVSSGSDPISPPPVKRMMLRSGAAGKVQKSPKRDENSLVLFQMEGTLKHLEKTIRIRKQELAQLEELFRGRNQELDDLGITILALRKENGLTKGDDR